MSPIISDSSLLRDPESMGAIDRRDYAIRIGMVREAHHDEEFDLTRYLVEVRDRPEHQLLVVCTLMVRFGGPYNYEEWIPNTAEPSSHEQKLHYNVRAGDVVLVAFINGLSREGVILGSLRHPTRPHKLSIDDGPTYISEFNGISQSINKDGEYTVTFKGQPTNLADFQKCLEDETVPTPVYDTSIGTTYFKFDKTGGWIIGDNASSKPQSFHIDKANGSVKIISGNTVATFDKNKDSVSIKTSKIAIGSSSVELLDQLTKLIDALGALTALSPVGPCAPLTGAPQWAQVQQIKKKIASIMGSL